ncbi:MAG: hypothetical protein FWG48_01925 [Oscillospiraceae bacterium]|nr:hypothetical protein [Oscillospiraceae bacterium]
MVVTNDIGRYADSYVPITYSEFSDASVMNRFGRAIIVGKGVPLALGAYIGDTVEITPAGAGGQPALFKIVGIDETLGPWETPDMKMQIYTPGLTKGAAIASN